MTQSFIKSISKSAKAAVVAALALVFWASGAAGAFFVRAQDKGVGAHESVCRIIYRFDSSVLYPEYLGNAATLEKLDSLATVCASNGVSGLVITSYSSLEGNFAYNTALSERRANTLKDYVLRQHPLLRGRISTNVQAESWEDLKIALLSDSRFNASEKDQIVSIITSDEDPDVREARLKALPSYKRLYAAYFSRLRYAEIRFVEDAAAAFGGASAAEPAGTPAEPAAAASATPGNLTDRNRVLFPLSSTTVDRAYATNNEVLEAISRLLESHNPDDFESIVVTSGSSIDGTTSSNDEISRERGESLVKWIEENYPQYKGRIVLNSRGEDWDVFREAVESDPNISRVNRNSILSIVDSNDTSDNKEARLRSLSSWDYIENNVLPRTRYASLDCTTSDKAAAAADSTSTDGTAAATASDSTAAADSTASDKSGAAAAASGDSTASDKAAAAADSTSTDGAAAAAASDKAADSRERKLSDKNRVLFSLNSTSVERDYADNDEVLGSISRLLENNNPEDFESIELTSGSSIDGTGSSNDEISRQRGESLLKWIEDRYPQYKDRIKLNSRGEDWDVFREAVESDTELDDDTRSSILAIADSSADKDEKEARLKELSCWDYIKDHILPRTRYASVRATRAKVEAPEPEALPDVEVEDENISVEAADSLDTTVAPVDTLAAPVEPEPVPLVKPLFAVSTNALYDLAITPNFAIEVPVSKKVTLFGEYTFPWWVTRDNSRAWEILKWDIGARYWFFGGRSSNPMDIMIGPFAGIDLGAGYYDIEPHHKGWQGEFQTVGAEIGWAWDLGKNWRLDAYVGAGWMGSHFRYYEATTGDKHLIYQESGKLTWFGPTKAGVSFKYIFGHKDRRTEK